MSILKIENINKSYNETKILDNFSLSVNKGEIVSITGPSGVRKIYFIKMYQWVRKN